MYHIILAGGLGKRFWPLSKEENPKQFLKIFNNASLLQTTYNRLKKISVKEKIFILSSKKYLDTIKKQINGINLENIILEPYPKNTAPAIYLAAQYIKHLDNDATIGIYPSDHFIKRETEFFDTINSANQFIDTNNDTIVTVGIKPTFPSTGYGYINIQKNKKQINKISKFIEKPNLLDAKKLITNSSNLWNSGMAFFKSSFAIEQIDLFLPELKKIFTKNINMSCKTLYEDLNRIWDSMPNISFDYAVLEKTKNSYCIQGKFDWTDAGTWKTYYDISSKDVNENVSFGNVINHLSKNNLVVSHNKLTAVVGLNNIAVINLNDATLVIDLTKCEEVKNIINHLNKE